MRLLLVTIMAAVAAVRAVAVSPVTERIDSIDRELSAARAELALLESERHQSEVWGRGRYTSFGMPMMRTDNGAFPRLYSNWGLFINKGTEFRFPRGKGFGGFIKVGVDVRWFDLEFVRYHSTERPLTFSSSPSTRFSGGGISVAPSYLKMRNLSLMAGAFGVGPTVSIAPLAWVDRGISSLKLTFYLLYQPCYVLNAYKGSPRMTDGSRTDLPGGSTVYEHGFANLVDFGMKLEWSRFSLGVEGRRGSGRIKDRTYRWGDADPFYLNGTLGSRYQRKFAETRIYIGIRI